MKITVEINEKIFKDNSKKFEDFFKQIVKAMGDSVDLDTSRMYGRYEVNTELRTCIGFCTLDIEEQEILKKANEEQEILWKG